MNKGFTLVELLVVITVIGLLSSVGYVGFQAITRSGRDALRRADIENIRSALEIYKADKNLYPPDDDGTLPPDYAPFGLVSGNYIESYPQDPNSTGIYAYVRKLNLTYDLCAHLENISSTTEINCGELAGDAGKVICGTGGKCNYRVKNP